MNQEQNNFNNIQNNNMAPNTQGMMPNMDMNGQVFNQQPVMGPANVEQVVQQQVQEVIQPVQPVMPEVQPEPQIVSQVNVQEPVNVVSTIEQPAMQVPVQEQVVTPVQEAVQMAAGVSNPEPTQIHSIIENTNNVIEPTQAVIPDTPVQPILEQQVSMPVQEPIQTANIVEPVQAEPQIVNQVNVQEPAPQMSQPIVMPEMNNQPTMEQPQTTIQPNVLNNQNVINPVNTETNNQNNTPVNDIKPPKKKSSFLTVVLVIIALGASFVGGVSIYNKFLSGNEDIDITNNEDIDENQETNDTNNNLANNEITLDYVQNAPETNSTLFEYIDVEGVVSITGFNGTDEVVVIPNQIDGKDVVSIGANAFANNSTMKALKLNDKVKTIEDSACLNCTELQIFISGSSLKTIEEYAFSSTKLEYAELNNGLETLEISCFGFTYLKQIEIPSSVVNINLPLLVDEVNNNGSITVIGEVGSAAEQYVNEKGEEYHLIFQAK